MWILARIEVRDDGSENWVFWCSVGKIEVVALLECEDRRVDCEIDVLVRREEAYVVEKSRIDVGILVGVERSRDELFIRGP
ncbi:hypothetical protein ASD23_13505 [Agromyces sp. Root1464]|nr:hypothetical protein ASD23_13505 [Agromyces sp. Root1464]